MEPETFKKIYPEEYLLKFLRVGSRPDGRHATKFRKTTLTTTSISTANGSALVRCGATSVLCGVKAEVAEPRIDSPNEGYLVPNIELSPMCSPRFKPGPPSDEQQVLSQKLNSLVKRCKIIDLSTLCIEPEKAVWVLYVDIQCLNYDGNVFDAALAAMTAALTDVRLPSATVCEDTGVVQASAQYTIPLSLQRHVFSTTVSLHEEKYILVDPSCDEEQLAATIVTVACDEDGTLCGIWKAGGPSVTADEMNNIIKTAQGRQKDWMALVASSRVPR